jgi:hypothetical protein
MQRASFAPLQIKSSGYRDKLAMRNPLSFWLLRIFVLFAFVLKSFIWSFPFVSVLIAGRLVFGRGLPLLNDQ